MTVQQRSGDGQQLTELATIIKIYCGISASRVNLSQKAVMKDKVRLIIGTLKPNLNANFLCVICRAGAIATECVRSRIKIVTISGLMGPGYDN